MVLVDENPTRSVVPARRDHGRPAGQAFVGVDNGGHYVYDAGSACADRATVDFLTTGHLPETDVYCTDVEQS